MIAGLATSVFGQDGTGTWEGPATSGRAHEHVLSSRINGTEYLLLVSLPDSYASEPARRYPVVYALDGNPSGAFLAGLQGILRLGPEIPELIVVGVSYPVPGYKETRHVRTVDYSPSSYPLADSVLSEDLGVDVRSGGGPDFLGVLEEEVLPFIDHNYRTTEDRALAGHSFGGLFVAYALLEDPDAFDRYLISSPSLWWNEGEMFAREEAFAEAHDALAVSVFASVGGLENEHMVPPITRFIEVLRSRDYAGLRLGSAVFADETHISVIPAAFSRGLRYLYEDVPREEPDSDR